MTDEKEKLPKQIGDRNDSLMTTRNLNGKCALLGGT